MSRFAIFGSFSRQRKLCDLATIQEKKVVLRYLMMGPLVLCHAVLLSFVPYPFISEPLCVLYVAPLSLQLAKLLEYLLQPNERKA